MSDDTLKIIQTVAEVIVINPGSDFEFETSVGCYETLQHSPESQTHIYRIKGGKWKLRPPFPFGSAFIAYHVSDPL